MTASARWLLSACESLDGVLAAEGISSLPDPDEPGAVLCRTARTVILAWRQPSGTGADCDITVRRFITATGFLSSATLGLAVYAPRHRLIDLQVVNASLAGKERRHNNHCAGVFRYAGGGVNARQEPWRKKMCYIPIQNA